MSTGPARIRDAGAEFIRDEASGGIALLAATGLAILWANLAAPGGYFEFWGRELTLGTGSLSITEDLQHWINDALMAIFFFVVGLEIKRELAVGELNERRKAALPVFAALGGVLLPGVIYLAFNNGTAAAGGWAIPMATDIAFAIAVMALFGKRLPSGVRLLLLTIAIVDDLIAILIIAAFYTDSLDLAWGGLIIAGVAIVLLQQRLGITRSVAYVPAGLLIWLGFFEAGIHATLAGVLLGLLTPARPFHGRMVIEDLEHRLHPWSALVVVPLFALANAGIVLDGGVIAEAVRSGLFWGIVAGLVAGKFLGIGGACTLVSRAGIGSAPAGVRNDHIWGIAALGGIGFTVSLFITGLAFDDPATIETAKLGIFAGSLLSALSGSLLLLRASRR